jgi:hypothetical protein
MADKETAKIAVTGKGRLMMPFLEKAMKTYRDAQFFDRTAQAVAAIQKEIELGDAGLLNKEGQEMTEKAKKNLAKPIPIVFDFKASGDDETVNASGPKGRRTLKYDLSEEAVKESKKDLDNYLDGCVKELVAELGRQI